MNDKYSEIAWYRQFWPWFLIAIPAAAVIAGVLTVYLAVVNPDRLIQRSEDERIGPVIFEAVNSNREQQQE